LLEYGNVELDGSCYGTSTQRCGQKDPVNNYYAQCGQLVEDMHTTTPNTKTVGRKQNKKRRKGRGCPIK
jgi:hypothetical protein